MVKLLDFLDSYEIIHKGKYPELPTLVDFIYKYCQEIDAHISLQSTVYILQSTVYSLQSTVYSLQSTVYSLHSTVYSLHSTVYSLQSTVYSLQSTVYSLQSTVYSLQSTVYSIQSTVFIKPQSVVPTKSTCSKSIHWFIVYTHYTYHTI